MRKPDGHFLVQSHDPEQESTGLLQLGEISDSVFSDIGCAVWKLRQKMFDGESGEAKEDFRQLARHVATIWDRLSEFGVTVQDHTGKQFDSGHSLEVLAIQPVEGILAETVIETVRPSIYRRDRQILKGQVIVGTPSQR